MKRMCSECEKPLGRKGWRFVYLDARVRGVHYDCLMRIRAIDAKLR